MKKLLILLLCCSAHLLHAQVFNNEWIDHTKTYYRFRIGKTGLHRIGKPELAAAGLASVPVEQLQLWRNGVEVPLATPVPAGPLPEGAFIEFWGERNDGKGDKALYRRPEYQLSDYFSLQTDSAAYFLTVNTAGNNRRLQPAPNEVSGNSLQPEPYFMYRLVQPFSNQLSGGFAIDVDQYLYSSAYDLGEGYCSAFIGPNASNTLNWGNLWVAQGGPQAKFKITVAGNRVAQRRYRVRINNDSITGSQVDLFNSATDSALVPLSVLATATNNVQVTNVSATANDRLAIYQYELTYPRQFNFGNAANFEFELPASGTARYLEITAFNNGGLQPVLLDLANGLRLLGDVSVAGKVRFVLPAMAVPGKMVLYSQAPANSTAISALTARRFVNYATAANQGDYLIISNQLLFDNGSGVNAVDQYARYRGSAAGGSYSVVVAEIDELTDQFGFGIKKTPLAVRNFIQFALNRFAARPKHVLLLGKGTVYMEQRGRESDPNILRLNLVPTFGNPASDVLLAAAPGTAVPQVSLGRLSVVSGQEILDYLEKVKQYEQTQKSVNPADLKWKKNVAHIIGSGDPNLQATLEQHLSACKRIISDTLWGANVQTFTKKTGANVEQISDLGLEQMFAEGLSFITYFGHSSNSGLDYNLDNPEAYNNTGKYPLFTALGCSAGNFFGFNTGRFTLKDAISEKYVLAPQKGTIGFIASTHFGIVSTLRSWNTQFYENLSRDDYGKTMGELMSSTAARVLAKTLNGEDNFIVRANIEETVFHGDPALKMNSADQPDYILTDPQVKVDPAFVSVADASFKLEVDVQNAGKAVDRYVFLQVKRQYPNGTEKIVVRDSIPAPRLQDHYTYTLPIDAVQDKGAHKLTITIDAANSVTELSENNNTVVKELFIYEDEARPVFPYNFAIVSRPDVELSLSTADPLSASQSYRVELDTTELFNSPQKWSTTLTGTGGLLQVKPGVALQHNTVYYWRVALVPLSGDYRWNRASFIFLKDGGEGFNQSHFYQFTKSALQTMVLDSVQRNFSFAGVNNDVFVRNTIFPTGSNQEADFTVAVNGEAYIRSACVGISLIFNVFDPKTFQPWKNVDAQGSNLFRFGSGSANCASSRNWNFEFAYNTAVNRKRMVDFMNAIPEGALVVVRNISGSAQNQNTYVADWQRDTAQLGSGISLYHALKSAGFSTIDSFYRPRSFIFVYQKGNRQLQPRSVVSEGIYDKITLAAPFVAPANAGVISSPRFGPAKAWKQFSWSGNSPDGTDVVDFKIVGITASGGADTLIRNITNSQLPTMLASVNAARYPYVQAVAHLRDTVNHTPFQLSLVRFDYTPVPEGAIAPNILFQMKDTLGVGEDLNLRLAFKNISAAGFDSLKVKLAVTDQNNVTTSYPLQTFPPLRAGDTLQARIRVDTRMLSGANTLYVHVNPELQPEQFQFNNFLYRKFYAKQDQQPPAMDVTFDNIRILNRDIVSAKPNILIKLTDESTRLLLDDTAMLRVKVRNLATNQTRIYYFDGDTLSFTPAVPGADNVATALFRPYFPEDGEYELIVTGSDKKGNRAGGAAGYKVTFQVINKPMISNMLNYPNPFTSSTAFVFVLTGSEVPQNLKIQILTVTGKVVREITRQELGTLRIGRNITDFKWDGTDQFGQKLANGVYLYRVVAQMEGKALDKFKPAGDQTDQYFNKGYGKMYLMR